jgi:hypothetical protein
VQDLEFGIWNLEFGIWNLEFGIWNLEFGIWNLEFGIWNFKVCVAVTNIPQGLCLRYSNNISFVWHASLN